MGVCHINAKDELAGKIMMLIHGAAQPDARRMGDILSDYKIEHRPDEEEMDFTRQVNHFIYAKLAEGISDQTAKSYRANLKKFNNYVNKPAGDVTTTDIRDFITYLSEVRKNRNTTVQSSIGTLRSFYGWLHNEEIISHNPTVHIKAMKIDKKGLRHPLTPEQMEMLRDACETYREKAIIEFLYSSGCRVSEAVQIDLENIDFERRCVSVIGKGSIRRTIFFSVKSKLMIQKYISERDGGTALFCAARSPYKRLGKTSVEKIVSGLGKRAGISKRVHPHVLRHTLASDLLNAGMDITIIQRVLGHSSVGVTEIYAKISQDNVYHEYQKFNT